MEQQQLCEICQSKNVCAYIKDFRDIEKAISELLYGTFVHNGEEVDVSSRFKADLQCADFIKIEPLRMPSVFESYLKGGK